MTRINVGILPKELPDKLLLAEHREIKRIPNMVHSGKAKLENIPDTFTLGKGHVRFFYDKLLYLYCRYRQLHIECIKRGFNVTDYSEAWGKIIEGSYFPTDNDRALLIERIESKGFKLNKSWIITKELQKKPLI